MLPAIRRACKPVNQDVFLPLYRCTFKGVQSQQLCVNVSSRTVHHFNHQPCHQTYSQPAIYRFQCVIGGRCESLIKCYSSKQDAVNFDVGKVLISSPDGDAELTDKLLQVKRLLKMTDSEVKALYSSLPRLQYDEVMDRFVHNIEIVQKHGLTVLKSHKLFCFLLQTESATFKDIVANWIKHQSEGKDMSLNVMVPEPSIDKYFEYIAKALDTKSEYFLLYGDKRLIFKMRERHFSIYTILEKIYFMKSEGFTSADIFDSSVILYFPVAKIKERIQKVRNEYGVHDMRLVVIGLIINAGAGITRNQRAMLSTLLECPQTVFTLDKTWNQYLQLSMHNATHTVDYLLEEGFSKTDMVACPFVVGYAASDVAKELQTLRASGNEIILKDRVKTIHAVVYLLEKRKAKVQKRRNPTEYVERGNK